MITQHAIRQVQGMCHCVAVGRLDAWRVAWGLIQRCLLVTLGAWRVAWGLIRRCLLVTLGAWRVAWGERRRSTGGGARVAAGGASLVDAR